MRAGRVSRQDAAREARRVPADISQQNVNPNPYGPPVLFYEDLRFTCRDCGSREVWTAEQQKWWYEVAKGKLYSTAARCRPCRRARRPPPSEAEPETPPEIDGGHVSPE